MNGLERMGAELAMLIRREHELTRSLAEATAKVNAMIKEIQEASTPTLYGAGTGEQERIDPVEWAHGTSPVQKPRNAPPAPPLPYRADHTDGGSTFRLTPIADTVTLPAMSTCPGAGMVLGPDRFAVCPETAPHVHTADGVQRVADL